MTAIYWKKASNGVFNTATNWNPASVPGVADDAIIDAIGTYTVTVSQNASVNSVDTISGATLAISVGKTFSSTFGGVNAGTITVADGGTLALSSLDNIGTVKLNATSNATSYQVDGLLNILGGNGHLTLSDNVKNQIIADANARTLDNLSDTISGAGHIGDVGDNHLTFINDHSGVVNATGTKALTIHTGNSVTNAGLLEATGAGGLRIQDAIDNINGMIEAVGSKAHVDLDGATITGGLFATSGGGQIKTLAGSSATIDASINLVSNTGTLTVSDNSTLFLKGNIINTGTVNISAGNVNTAQIVVKSASSIGGGQIVLSDSSKNAIVTDGTNETFQVVGSIKGAGTIGDNHMAFKNFIGGIINATGKNALVMAANSISNEGTMEATGTGHLTIAGNVLSNTAIEAFGTSHVLLSNTVISNPIGVVGAMASGSHIDVGTVAAGGTAEIDGGQIVTVAGGTIATLAAINQATPTTLTIKDATIQNTGALTISDNSKLVLSGTTATDTIFNNGVMSLNASAKSSVLTIDGAKGAIIGGSGKFNLSDNSHNSILSNGTDTTLALVGGSISGAGTIGDGHLSMTISAGAVVNASAKTNEMILAAKTITNNGLIELTGKGGLEIDVLIDNEGSVVDNASSGNGLVVSNIVFGGTISAAASGAVIKLNNGALVGTNVSTVAGATITTIAGTTNNIVVGLQNSGTVAITDNSALSLGSAISNAGTIKINAAGDQTELIANDLRLSGHGKVVMTDDTHNLIASGQAANSVVNGTFAALIGGSVTAGDFITLKFDGTDFHASETFVIGAGMTKAQIASGLAAEINDDLTLAAHSIHAVANGSAIGISQPGDIASSTMFTGLVSPGATETVNTAPIVTGTGVPKLFENVDNTITGAGTIGDGNNMALINDANGVINANGKHLMTIDTGSNTVINSGTIEVTNTGGLKIDSGVVNFGHLIANGGNLEIDGTLTGFGGATIMGKGVIDLEAVNNLQDITFAAGSTGELKLAHSDGYAGRISGFGANHTQSIDLLDINFATATRTFAPAGSNIEGILTVSDGTHSANLTLVGHYVTANFTLSNDGTGHTLIVDPPVHGHDMLFH